MGENVHEYESLCDSDEDDDDDGDGDDDDEDDDDLSTASSSSSSASDDFIEVPMNDMTIIPQRRDHCWKTDIRWKSFALVSTCLIKNLWMRQVLWKIVSHLSLVLMTKKWPNY